jgi:hypothetical protein
LVEAGKGTIGALTDQLRLICHGFSASVGFYADRIRIALAAAGATTLIAVGPACSHSRERRRGAGVSPAFILPPSASTLAPRTYALYFALVGVSLAIVGLVLVLIVSFPSLCRRFRRLST